VCGVSKTKTSPHRKKAPLSPLPIVPPFSRIHLDHIGPLPVTPEGYHHLLVVIDATTLWAEAFPVKSTTAEETANILYREIICRFGAPKAIHSDQGTAFRNRVMTLLCKLLHIKHIYFSPFHPEGNAKVERANRTISTTLKLVCPNQTEWAKFIAPILYSYRASVVIPLGISPFEALVGKQMSMGIDLQLLQESENAPSTSVHVVDLISKLKLIQDIVQQNMTDSGQRVKQFYDVTTQTPQITVGSKVLLHSSVIKPGQSAKFHKPWDGPYLVTSKSDDGLLYTLRHCNTGKPLRTAVHANRVKLFDADRDAFYSRHNVKPRDVPRTTPPSPSTFPIDVPDASNDVWYSIDRLLKHRKTGNKVLYLVKWQDNTVLGARREYYRLRD